MAVAVAAAGAETCQRSESEDLSLLHTFCGTSVSLAPVCLALNISLCCLPVCVSTLLFWSVPVCFAPQASAFAVNFPKPSLRDKISLAV